MAKKRVEVLLETIKREIDDMISDKGIGWESLCDALEEIEDHAGEWARQIRDEHKDE